MTVMSLQSLDCRITRTSLACAAMLILTRAASAGWEFDSGQSSVGGIYGGDYWANWSVTTNAWSVRIVGEASASAFATSQNGGAGQNEISQAKGTASGRWIWVGGGTSTPVAVSGSISITGYISSGNQVVNNGSAYSFSWFAASAASNGTTVYGNVQGVANDWDIIPDYTNATWNGSAYYTDIGNGYLSAVQGDYTIDLDFSYTTSSGASSITAVAEAYAYAHASAATTDPGYALAAATSECYADIEITLTP